MSATSTEHDAGHAGSSGGHRGAGAGQAARGGTASELGAGGSRGTSVIVNVLQVIRCFTVEEPILGVTEIAARVGLHKSSVSRILATLEQELVVERDTESRKFRLGLGLIAVAGPLLANLDVRRVSMEDLHALSEDTGETAALNIWDGAAAVTVEQVPSRRQVKHTSVLGSRYATGLSASVQVYLAHEDPAEVRRLIEEGRITFDAPTDPDEYLARLAEVRTVGAALNYCETSEDEVGIAAPVLDHRGSVVATVLVAAPYYRVPRDAVDRIVQSCTATARRISTRMGFTPPQ